MLFFFSFWSFFLLLVFQVFLGPNIRFVLKMDSDSDVRDVSVPIDYEHRDFAECVFLAVLTVFILLILQVMAKIIASFLDSLDYLLLFLFNCQARVLEF
jgi:hypothetical protein